MQALLRDAAPRLRDDSDVKKAIEAGVTEELEKIMKFWPGMTSVEQLLHWNATIAGPRMGPVKELAALRSDRRIMSMHDMAGAYNELSDNDYLMMFRSWEVVDMFVYFSHVRIAVPPLQWIMVAHQHQRPAIGTLILEQNEESLEFVQQMGKHRDAVIDKLVHVAEHYGFDGWFVNIETSPDIWQQGDPERFVGDLRRKMKEKVGQRAQVIAYPYGPEDQMFQHADGVFVNYNWPDDPASMDSVAQAAGDRVADVYMGMDSFGSRRGDNEPEPRLVQLCAERNLSVAVFGPGYTLEVMADRKYSNHAVDFDKRYWSSIGQNFGRKGMSALKNGTTWPIPWEHDGEKTKEAPMDSAGNNESVLPRVAAGAAVVIGTAFTGAALGATLPASAAAGVAKATAGAIAGVR